MNTLHNYQRRSFIRKIAGTAAMSLALPYTAAGKHTTEFDTKMLPPETANEEDYWTMVKDQYQIDPGLIMMNAGNFCPSPHPVSRTMIDHLNGLNGDASSQDRKKYDEIYQQAVSLLAEYLGVFPEEIAITRNTSEGNNTINNGLDLKPGDEVVYWSQNHQTLNIAWEVRAKRAGFKIVKVVTPQQPEREEDLIRPFVKAITKNTKLICFSHISNQSGTVLPAKKLCALARERGALSLVDGAQSFGFMDLDLKDMGCDFYTGSSHKWLTGPKESGVLYVRKEVLSKIWPLIVSKDWTWENEWKIENLIRYGQRNDATIAAFGEAIRFHQVIGKERVERRVRTLVDLLIKKMRSEIPEVEFVTPVKNSMYACILVFKLPGTDPDQAVTKLYTNHKIAAAATHDGFNGIRLSPNIYNTEKEIDRLVDVLREFKL